MVRFDRHFARLGAQLRGHTPVRFVTAVIGVANIHRIFAL